MLGRCKGCLLNHELKPPELSFFDVVLLRARETTGFTTSSTNRCHSLLLADDFFLTDAAKSLIPEPSLLPGERPLSESEKASDIQLCLTVLIVSTLRVCTTDALPRCC
mmetsp:Transcript_81315/g.242329  ORF Transcript_81315/g.242329 Transcript_81315/m.242329 type:complete len:108 (+) Transcript_81315:130-453(+)